jgi:glycerate-2-kinase
MLLLLPVEKYYENLTNWIDELNILRKNIEVLKGGGLAKQAKPAQVF